MIFVNKFIKIKLNLLIVMLLFIQISSIFFLLNFTFVTLYFFLLLKVLSLSFDFFENSAIYIDDYINNIRYDGNYSVEFEIIAFSKL